jgi:ABC-type Co2+ transport system permease subunit
MKNPLPSLSQFSHASPPKLRRNVALAFLLFAALFLFALVPGCATTERGLSREEAIYTWATNAVATARSVTPFIPAPAGTGVEIGLGLVAAALAAWNTAQQRAIQKLKNGNGTAATASAGTRPPTTGS